jgi:hypothetical protein
MLQRVDWPSVAEYEHTLVSGMDDFGAELDTYCVRRFALDYTHATYKCDQSTGSQCQLQRRANQPE